MPVIFDEYANRKIGSSALATWLNEQGYRTKTGRLWTSASVITVLRNRVYLGEIYYRGNWYPAPHEPLIPTELFERAQAILTDRCEDRSQRRSNPTEYLLSGRIRCGRCGKPYIGTASHGRNGRYTYYTCFTRMRHGTKHCDNDRLPAEQLEQAVTRRLWKVLDDHDLIEDAITRAYERLTQRDDEQQGQLAAVQSQLAQIRAALDRYFRAFEAGTMPEDTCAPRIAALNDQAKALETHASELAAHQDDEQPERATAAELDTLRDALRSALKDTTPTRAKTVLHIMIDEIRVDARDHIEPTFRVPAVRVDYGYMEPTRLNICTTCNNGWMSQLEEQVKPILTPMLLDQPRTLTAPEQHTVANVGDEDGPNHAGREHRRQEFTPAADYHWFHDHRAPLPNAHIWLCRYGGQGNWPLSVHQWGLTMRPKNRCGRAGVDAPARPVARTAERLAEMNPSEVRWMSPARWRASIESIASWSFSSRAISWSATSCGIAARS